MQTGIRVTVKKLLSKSDKLIGEVVSPETPRKEDGLYWGYQVILIKSFMLKILSRYIFKFIRLDMLVHSEKYFMVNF